MTPGRSAVDVRDIVIDRGTTRAVDGLSFCARSGEITVLLGPNGAGKTSTVEHLEGYLHRSAGAVAVLGLDPSRHHAELTRRVGVMLQSGGIPTGIRPHEVLEQYASFFTDPLDPAELLDRVGLASRRRVAYRRLSGGEQQRLSLALALVGRPELVFLDEPTAGLDLEGRDLVRALVAGLVESGTTVVMTTHDLAEAEALAHKVVIIDRGRLVAEGSPAELVSGIGAPPVDIRFAAPPGIDTAALGEAVAATVHEVAPGEYVAGLEPTPAAVAALTAWLADHHHPLGDLRAGRQRLEDVFRRLTAEGPADGTPGGTGRSPDGSAGDGSP